jgi:hypothetical protein
MDGNTQMIDTETIEAETVSGTTIAIENGCHEIIV